MPTKPSNSLNIDKVLECISLYRDPDKRVSKKMIAYYLRIPYNTTTDRNIRDSVTELRKQGHPICSNAGKGGYWYDPDSVSIVIADYQSRIADMSETVRALKRGHHVEIRQLELAV